MQLISRITITLILLAAALLAWEAWHPPISHTPYRTFRIAIAPPPAMAHQLWQVTTRPFLQQSDAQQARQRLIRLGFSPVIVSTSRVLQWTRFWDPHIYHDPAQALEATALWKQHGIQAEQRHDQTGYHLQLGKEYDPMATAGVAHRLSTSGLDFRQQTTSAMTKVWHLRFPPQSKDDADITWRVVQKQGMLDPVLEKVVVAASPSLKSHTP